MAKIMRTVGCIVMGIGVLIVMASLDPLPEVSIGAIIGVACAGMLIFIAGDLLRVRQGGGKVYFPWWH